eukprot:scaffold29354_cov60-Phaeocystis_antarctica.AAC.2
MYWTTSPVEEGFSSLGRHARNSRGQILSHDKVSHSGTSWLVYPATSPAKSINARRPTALL